MRQPLPRLLSKCQNQERGSGQLFRRLALVPSNLFPTSSCVGGGIQPQPAPTPLTSRQRALTLSLCVLSNLPNIAARSLSTVLFPAYFPFPKDAKSAVPSLNGCISHHASPSALASGDIPAPQRKCAGRRHSIFRGLDYLAQDGTCARTYLSDIKKRLDD